MTAPANTAAQNLCVEGTDEYGCYAADAESAPFVIYDIAAQRNLPGYYPTRAEAEAALASIAKATGATP